MLLESLTIPLRLPNVLSFLSPNNNMLMSKACLRILISLENQDSGLFQVYQDQNHFLQPWENLLSRLWVTEITLFHLPHYCSQTFIFKESEIYHKFAYALHNCFMAEWFSTAPTQFTDPWKSIIILSSHSTLLESPWQALKMLPEENSPVRQQKKKKKTCQVVSVWCSSSWAWFFLYFSLENSILSCVTGGLQHISCILQHLKNCHFHMWYTYFQIKHWNMLYNVHTCIAIFFHFKL